MLCSEELFEEYLSYMIFSNTTMAYIFITFLYRRRHPAFLGDLLMHEVYTKNHYSFMDHELYFLCFFMIEIYMTKALYISF